MKTKSKHFRIKTNENPGEAVSRRLNDLTKLNIKLQKEIEYRKNAEERVNQLNRVYSVLSNINEAIVRIKDKKNLLDESCRILVEEGNVRMAWVGFVDDQSKQVIPYAKFGFDNGYIDNLDISILDIPSGKGTVGSCIREDRYIFIIDIKDDPRMEPWKEAALERGYNSACSFPLKVNSEVTGAITIYTSETNFYDNEEIRLMEGLAAEISFALESLEREKKLIGSELSYRRLFESAKDGIIILNADTGEIMDVNPYLVELLGYSHKEFLGKTIWDIGFFKDIIENKKHFVELQKKKYIRYEDLPLETSKGYKVQVEFVSNEYPVNSHKVIQCNIRDITERKRSEEMMLSSELRYRRLFESAEDGIIILNADSGMIEDVNPYLVKLLGYSHKEFLGKTIWDIGFFKDIVANKENFLELRQKEYIRYEDLPLETLKGHKIQVEFVSNVYTVNHNKVIQCNIRDITERKRSEEMMLSSELRYRLLFESAEDGIIILNADSGMIEDVNPYLVKLVGYSREDFLDKTIWDIGFFKDIVANKENFLELRQKEYIRYEDLPLETSNGQKINVEFVSNVYLVNNQKVIQCNIRNITERKVVENLHALELRYRRLFESAQDGILILDADSGMIEDVNPYLVKLLGYSREDFLGKTIWDIGFFKDIIENKEHFVELQKKKYIRYEDLPLETSNGQKINVEFVSNVYTVNNNKVIQCNIRNITDRKQAENALKESDRRLRSIVESSTDQIFMLDKSLKYLLVNKSLANILGKLPEDIIGRSIYEVYDQETAVKFSNNINRVFQTAKSMFIEEKMTAQGQELFVSTIINPVMDDMNRVIAVTGIVRDITERKKSEEKIKENAEQYLSMKSSDSFGFFLVDEDRKIVDVNEFICKMLGYSREEILNRSIFDFAVPDTPGDFEKITKTIIEKGKFRLNANIKLKMEGFLMPILI